MSVIGTTLKQPRVFAHDAVALVDLPGCIWRGVKGYDFQTGNPDGNPGEGFVAGECYQTYNETSNGAGAYVLVTGVGDPAVGDITSVDICEDFCAQGGSYNEGDILTVIWEPDSGGTFTSGSDCTGLVQVDSLSANPWDYGCPFSPIGSRFDIDGSEDIPKEYNPLKAFRQKDIIKYSCGGEEPFSAECNWETWGPGAALYIGFALERLVVIMESGNKAVYHNLPSGSFLPISCLTVCEAKGAEIGEVEPPDPEAMKDYILALF